MISDYCGRRPNDNGGHSQDLNDRFSEFAVARRRSCLRGLLAAFVGIRGNLCKSAVVSALGSPGGYYHRQYGNKWHKPECLGSRREPDQSGKDACAEGEPEDGREEESVPAE
jgi:hypothetical protein